MTTACDEDGFSCDLPGHSIETLPLEKGYMRMRGDSDQALLCLAGEKNADNCPGGPAAGCAGEGHGEGATCGVCEGSRFFDAAEGKCQDCGGSLTDANPVTIVSIILFGIAFVVLLYVLVAMSAGTTDAKKAGKLGRLRNKLKAKWKIIFVGFNIMSSMPALLPEVEYPPMYSKFIGSIDLFQLDFAKTLPLECMYGGGGHYEQLLFMTIAPLSIVLIVVVLANLKARVSGQKPENFGTAVITVVVLVTYLVLPAVTTTIFRTFDCVTLDDPRGGGEDDFLRAHFPTRCNPASSYGFYRAYAIVCVFIWPVGVPSLYFFELFNNRHKLDPPIDDEGTKGREADGVETVAKAIAIRETDTSIAHLQLLYGPYEPEFYLWEVWEMIRRLMATSLLLAFDGPLSKLFFLIFLGLMTVKYYAFFAPFTSPSDDTLAEAINWIVVFAVLGALCAYMSGFDDSLDYFFIGINILCLIIIIVLIYSDINREKAALKLALTEARALSKSLSKRASQLLSPKQQADLNKEVAPEDPRDDDDGDDDGAPNRRDDDKATEVAAALFVAAPQGPGETVALDAPDVHLQVDDGARAA